MEYGDVVATAMAGCIVAALGYLANRAIASIDARLSELRASISELSTTVSREVSAIRRDMIDHLSGMHSLDVRVTELETVHQIRGCTRGVG